MPMVAALSGITGWGLGCVYDGSLPCLAARAEVGTRLIQVQGPQQTPSG
jgi:hypothetical protein